MNTVEILACIHCHKRNDRDNNNAQLFYCSRCRKVAYCSKDCQVKDWKLHKHGCNPSPGLPIPNAAKVWMDNNTNLAKIIFFWVSLSKDCNAHQEVIVCRVNSKVGTNPSMSIQTWDEYVGGQYSQFKIKERDEIKARHPSTTVPVVFVYDGFESFVGLTMSPETKKMMQKVLCTLYKQQQQKKVTTSDQNKS